MVVNAPWSAPHSVSVDEVRNGSWKTSHHASEFPAEREECKAASVSGSRHAISIARVLTSPHNGRVNLIVQMIRSLSLVA